MLQKKTLRDEYPANQCSSDDDPPKTKKRRRVKKVIGIDEHGNIISEQIIGENEKEDASD